MPAYINAAVKKKSKQVNNIKGQIARQLIQCGRLGQFRLASRLLYSG
jgi:hypothetical protein